MTEAEWLACTEPQPMVDFLSYPGCREGGDFEKWLGTRPSHRKLRLFACACCRRISRWLTERDQRTLDIVEAVADGLVPDIERTKALRALSGIISRRWGTRLSDDPESFPEQAVQCAASRAPGISAWAAPKLSASTFAYTPRKGRKTPQRKVASALEKSECLAQARLVRDILGNPFRPVTADPSCLAWNNATVVHLAQAIYDERAFDRMPLLADALEDAGCTNQDILEHCRGGGEHVRGCWVVDLLLGKS